MSKHFDPTRLPAASDLPAGVVLRPLVRHSDERGSLVEMFRGTWRDDLRPVQWNASSSGPGVLRGVHVHAVHTDYLTVVAGSMLLGLSDIRPDSPTRGHSVLLRLESAAPQAVVIPPGVAHGFYFDEPSLHIYGVTAYWDPDDELGCRFDSPELGLEWPDPSPRLSARDAAAGSYAAMLDAYRTAAARKAR
ncbi:MAG TPA: dTDP-4-dehydrorhamnose 3,5-epimerase family protein [Bauldia sp.]|nr:dTDP-4-dehydrorhamnose 3,5-epimerase family protein [Bauldia sp.]